MQNNIAQIQSGMNDILSQMQKRNAEAQYAGAAN